MYKRQPHAKSLLQTISRVNRPYKSPNGKIYKYGYIVDFVDIEEEYDRTIEAVSYTHLGVYSCCQDKEFHILLFAYAFDNEEVKIIDFTKNEKLPKEVLEALLDDNIIKSAFNANFERICISAYLNLYLSPKSWKCSKVHAL